MSAEIEAKIAEIAARIREGGVPDFLNRWLGMTPEKLAATEAARERQTRRETMPAATGAKEAALRAQREKKAGAEPSVKKHVATVKTVKKGKFKTAAGDVNVTLKRVSVEKDAGSAKRGSKREIITAMLKRPGGCTTADILKETGWPSVSVPAQAEAAGLKLKKVKLDGVTVYSAE